jgi:hypothetical protein
MIEAETNVFGSFSNSAYYSSVVTVKTEEMSFESQENEHTAQRFQMFRVVQANCLFAPLHTVLKRVQEAQVFDVPSCEFSLKYLKEIDVDSVQNGNLEDQQKDDHKLDELLTILRPGNPALASKMKINTESPAELIPSKVSQSIHNLQTRMGFLYDEIGKTRPLLVDENSTKIIALRHPLTKVVQAERMALQYEKQKIKLSRKKRFLPSKGIKMMKDWLFANADNPYPSPEQKLEFVKQGKIKLKQVEYWFINARARIFKRIEASRRIHQREA